MHPILHFASSSMFMIIGDLDPLSWNLRKLPAGLVFFLFNPRSGSNVNAGSYGGSLRVVNLDFLLVVSSG
jgi:hypothetical protein